MRKIVRAINRSLQQGQAVVLCTISSTDGSAPRTDGSKMVVFQNGETVGTVGGGKIEYLTIQKALCLFENGFSDTATYHLRGEDEGGCGMICGGDVTIFFHRIDADNEKYGFLYKYAELLLDIDEDIWLVTDMNAANIPMDIFCSALPNLEEINKKAGNADRSNPVFQDGHWLFGEEDFSWMSEMDFVSRAQGHVERYLVEPLSQMGKTYIFGSGHVAKALSPVLTKVGFRTVILDELPVEEMKDAFPEAYSIYSCDFNNISKTITIGARDYVVIMTRGHLGDFVVLEQALQTQAEYVGMIGSKKKQAVLWSRLIEDGFTQGSIDRIHNPIGLSILAETPEEIAISIAGELICHRAKVRGGKKHGQCMK